MGDTVRVKGREKFGLFSLHLSVLIGRRPVTTVAPAIP
jgi:hypothetical protein